MANRIMFHLFDYLARRRWLISLVIVALFGWGAMLADVVQAFRSKTNTGLSAPGTSLIPNLEAFPVSLDFGDVGVGAIADRTFVLSNTGVATLQVGSLTSTSESLFTCISPLPGFTIAPREQRIITVRFKPTSLGSQAARLEVASTLGYATIDMTGNGVSAGPAQFEELRVDDGTMEAGAVGSGLIFVNKLTPSRYPSKLQTIRVYFFDFLDPPPPPSGVKIRLLAFNLPSTSNLPYAPAYMLDQMVTIPALTGRGYVDFDIPNGPVITYGDWYVGFQAPTPRENVYCAVDRNNPSAGNSFYSFDGGSLFYQLSGGVPAVPINAMLRAVVFSGTLATTGGNEADLSPRTNGNNNAVITISDSAQVGRFAAAMDTLLGGEFQRADCAPKETKGNGKITIADWVQAGRYAAGLDPVAVAGGPTSQVNSAPVVMRSVQRSEAQQGVRTVRAKEINVEGSFYETVAIEFDSSGNENALSFSLSYDPTQLLFVFAKLGDDAAGASMNVNITQVAGGRLGLALALPANQTFGVGMRQLITLSFASVAQLPGPITLTFGDQPVGREVVDATASELTATWAGASGQSLASVSAASFANSALAREAIVSAFGTNLATGIQIARTLPLPTELARTTVKIKDSRGIDLFAPLFFVSPTQITYQVPGNASYGMATVKVISNDGSISSGNIVIASVSPGLFSVNVNGQGIAAATVLRVKSDGSQSYEQISRFDSALGRIVTVPIDLGPEGDQVFLLFYGTGWRNRSSLSAVITKIGGQTVETLYAGLQGDFVGLDQVNARLSRNLIGRGEVDVLVTVDGVTSNTVRVNIK